MKTMHKIAVGAAMILGVSLVAAPASAQSFGFSFGGPGYGFGYQSGFSCNPYSRYYDPFRCRGRAFTDRYYYPGYYYGRPYYGRPYYGYNRPYYDRRWRG